MIKRYTILLLISLVTFFSCHDPLNDEMFKRDDGKVDVILQFGDDFSNTTLSTRTGDAIQIATEREYTIKNAVLFAFENYNPGTLGYDPNGRLLQYGYAGALEDAADKHLAQLIEMPGVPVTLIGIGNIPPETLENIFAAYEYGNTEEGFASGDYVTLASFNELTTQELGTETINGKLAVANTELVLQNSDDGYLPMSIDPVTLTSLTQEKVDEQAAASKFITQFGYTRIDIIVQPEDPVAGQKIKLVEACLSNVPTIPLYAGDPSSVSYVDRTQIVTRATNIKTLEQADAQDADNYHLIQGLYTYPVIVDPTLGKAHRSYAIVKAETSVSENDGEYYKILIQYNPNATMSGEEEELTLNRDTRYRLIIKDFSGNGYKTIEEAIDGEPSNVKYDIVVDPDRGNEFVITNGSIYMALSNTRVDIYGTGVNLQNRDFTAFTVYYDKNDTLTTLKEPKKYIHIEAEDVDGDIITDPTDIGVEIANASDFLNIQDDSLFRVKLKIINPVTFQSRVNSTADIVVRIGDLMQKVTLRHIPISDDETEITTYTENEAASNFKYAYFVPDTPNDYKAWIFFNGNNVMEYDADSGPGGIPISFTSLQQGQRDNFECPIYLYDKIGTSTRALVYQESYELVDFSDTAYVKWFLNIDNTDVPTEELVVSNCYILNPSSLETRKFIIPVEQRINQFLSESKYISSGESAPYSSLPDNWKVKVSWYDSQRIYDGGLTFTKETEDINGQQCMSVIIPRNFQRFGTMLVTVYVPGSTDTNLWHWVIWVTDYDPYTILRSSAVKNNITGTGVYTVNGAEDLAGTFYSYKNTIPGTTVAGPNSYPNALHRYQGGNWDTESAGTINYGSNIGRLIMDRNNGSFSATFAGHGGIMNSTTGASTSNPVSGWLVYQTGNIVPYPGAGAVYSDGSALTVAGIKQYASFRKAIQNPQNFYYGDGSFSFSTWLDNRVVTGTASSYTATTSLYVGYDVNLPKNSSSSYNVKSIFDGSPLGFMTPSHETFHIMNDNGSSGTTFYDSPYLSYDVAWPRNTAAVYRNFAYFYFTGFRTSGGGGFRLGKNYDQGAFFRVTRPNRWWSTWGSYFVGRYNNSTASNRPGVVTLADAGDGGGIQLRPVTQFRYDN